MLNNFKASFNEKKAVFIEKLNEQEWFRELKSKWDELDQQTQLLIRLGSILGVSAILLFYSITSMWGVYSMKSELAAKHEALLLIKNASEEMRVLQGRGQPGDAPNWGEYLKTLGQGAGLLPDGVVISNERAGGSTDLSTESLMDVKLARINIKQAIKYALQIENGPHPVKVRSISFETDGIEGHLNINLALSAFAMKKEK